MVEFSWTTGNQFATDVTISLYTTYGRVVSTENLRRDQARNRWSIYLAEGWQRQLTSNSSSKV